MIKIADNTLSIPNESTKIYYADFFLCFKTNKFEISILSAIFTLEINKGDFYNLTHCQLNNYTYIWA
jgi:hypothetical protein